MRPPIPITLTSASSGSRADDDGVYVDSFLSIVAVSRFVRVYSSANRAGRPEEDMRAYRRTRRFDCGLILFR